MSIKRRAMREEERAKAKVYDQSLEQAKQSGEQAQKFIKSMLNRFRDNYNAFLKSASNISPAQGVDFNLQVTALYTNEAEMRKTPHPIPEELFKTALRNPENPNQIKIQYLRCEKVTFLKEGTKIQARPGVPESVQNDIHTSLLYHAAVILTKTQKEELEQAAAVHKLTDDLIQHLFISGVQYQEMMNEKQWQQEAKMQNENLKHKVDEVNEMFSQAAEMKVSH